MKKKTLLLTFLLLPLIGIVGQVPTAFQYQAVFRNDDGSTMVNTPLSVKIVIHQSAVNGKIVYQETHTTATNETGIINLRIGAGVNPSPASVFQDIDWSSDLYFFETLINKGSGFVSMGAQQLTAVPYAKYAASAQNVYIESPNGKKWKITIDNNGIISSEAIN